MHYERNQVMLTLLNKITDIISTNLASFASSWF